MSNITTFLPSNSIKNCTENNNIRRYIQYAHIVFPVIRVPGVFNFEALKCGAY